ncbi:MAG: tetratricopeptide repeat protein, partial [Candidatus Hydrogenedentes bacterium]|nr:tetratricopeptide repeat protein [Candidatus Hydrogenedentota bacterium]
MGRRHAGDLPPGSVAEIETIDIALLGEGIDDIGIVRLYRQSDPEEAAGELETALRLCEAAEAPTRQLADVLVFLGQLLLDLDRAEEAAAHLTRAIEVHRQIGTRARTVALVRLRLAEALLAAGRLDDADEQLDQVGAIASRFHREMAE